MKVEASTANHWLLSACAAICAIALGVLLSSCGSPPDVRPNEASASAAPLVAVAVVNRKPLGRDLTMSSELVPFEEIDVFAKESGYVSKLLVDYGSHVKKGQLLAVLEIPELQALLQEDQAGIKSASDQVTNAQHQLSRVEAQHNVFHLQYERLDGVAKTKPGLVAQQEVDDAQGKDLAAEAQIEGAKSSLELAQSQFAQSQSKLAHDQALFDYSRITAPFAGVVTQRYANLGTLLQAGTNSSTQAMPLVRLSQEDLFRLVIPVPESYVSYIKLGDLVDVKVPSLNRSFPGKIARFSKDVSGNTRTMHTEVDVPNSNGVLIPGVYAEANLVLDRKDDALAVPLQAISQSNGHNIVYVVDAGNHIQVRTIATGIQTESDAEVLSGLDEGAQVVIGDTSGLRAGETVQPKITEAGS